MNKEFAPYEQSLALKELGFDEPCLAHYTKDKKFFMFEIQFNTRNSDVNENLKRVSAPTFSQAFRWFRDKHGLYHYILPEFYKNGINFNWQILWYLPKEEWTNHRIYNGTMLYGDNGEYPTQEKAELACLKKLIEIVKSK